MGAESIERELPAIGAVEDRARSLAWWRDELAGAPRELSLPPARTPEAPARSCLRTVPRPAVGVLQALARDEGTTLDVVCLAGLVTLLHRYTGELDFLVGVSGTERFVLRAEAAGDPTLRDIVRRVDARARRALAYPLPLEEIADGHPYHVACVFRQGEEPSHAGVALTVRIEERDEGLVTTLEHDSGRIDPEIVDGLARHFVRLLDAGGQTPDQPVRSLAMLDPEERDAIVRLGAGAPVAVRARPFHLAFAEIAARQPSALAVAREKQRITYGELEARSNALAHHLLGIGLEPEGRVGICLPRSPDLLVAILGVWKAGGAYVPIDPAHPRDRIAFVGRDSGIVALITTEALLGGLPSLERPIVCLDGEAGRRALANPPPTAAGVVDDRLAYLIYTSGSTGRPRAVMVEHGSLANAAATSLSAYRLGPETRMLHLTSPSFDASLDEMFVLLGGGALIAPPEEAEAPGPELLAFIASERITAAMFTPSTLAAMDPRELPELELIVVGGEACSAEIIDRWQPGRRVLNAYGPTEATVYATLATCVAGAGTPTIGRPIAGTHAYVVDRNLELVPRGIPGELCIGGAAVARGYHGRPDLTSAVFVPDPYQDLPGARMYRTGDVTRFRPDGELEYFGRRDDQVKVRGVRIDLGEICAVLLEHAAVREAVVVQRRDGGGALVGYVVLRPAEGTGALGDLRKHLRDRLPAAYIPSFLVPLDAIPLNTSGKVDRDRLPAPTRADAGVPFQPPRTPGERALFGIWTELLRHDEFGIEHDFFDVGGHSLSAAQLIARIQRQFGIRLSLSEIVRNPTIREMSDAIERQRKAQTGPRAQPTTPAVTRFQRACWQLAARDPRLVAVHDRSVRIRGALDVEALDRAIAEVVARHAILRATFRLDDEGQVVPVDARGRRARLVVHDLRSTPSQAQVERTVRTLRSAPFDLGAGPLFRRALVSISDDEHILSMLFHPVITDATAEAAVASEIAALYPAFRDAMRPTLAPPRAQLADALAKAHAAAPTLPRPVTPVATGVPGEARSSTIPRDLWRTVVDHAGLAPDVLALAAFARSVVEVLGESVPIAVPVSSTALADYGVLVAPWLDLGAVEVDVSAARSRDAILSATAAALTQARARSFEPSPEPAAAWPRVAFELRPRPRPLALDGLEVSPLAGTPQLDLPGDLALQIEVEGRDQAVATVVSSAELGHRVGDVLLERFEAALAWIAGEGV